MPTFYEMKPVEILEQTMEADEYAAAYLAAQESISSLRKKEVKAGICLTVAAVIGALIPAYHTHSATYWVPIGAIAAAVLLAALFYFVQPSNIKRWAAELYRSNALLALPEKISIYRDSVLIENQYEQMMEYWTDFYKCVESKSLFVAIGGRERNLLVIKKQTLTEEQRNTLSAHFADAFASRYQKSGR